MWEVLNLNKLPGILASIRIRPDYLLDLNPAQQCGPAELHFLNLRWLHGVAHRGVTLRYQHQLPSLQQ
jgi:hypothetical protein